MTNVKMALHGDGIPTVLPDVGVLIFGQPGLGPLRAFVYRNQSSSLAIPTFDEVDIQFVDSLNIE